MDDENTVEVDIEQLQLVLDLTNTARNPRTDVDITPFMGGTARANAARKAHDRLQSQVNRKRE